MKARILISAVLLMLLSGLTPFPVQADGIIIPEPPICRPGPCPPFPTPMAQLAIRYHHVEVEIADQVAVTRIDQVFYNPNDWAVEGTYVFPLPREAAATDFSLWIDGEPVKGEVLEASQARRTYEEIVRSLQDPALLEYADRGALQASLFPIPPEGERRIQLEYTQVLTAEQGLVRYIYPLNTEKFSARPLESVSITVDLRSREAIRAVYSPTHSIDLNRLDDHHVTAGYEVGQITPDSDFALYYSIGESEAFHLLSYRDPGDAQDPDGFFLLLLAPRPQLETPALPKDLLLVLDRSGSMDGEKFVQAQEALRYILRRLNPDDRFNLIAFSTGVESYANALRPADEANQALSWVDRLSAQGSTDINRALLEAAAMSDRERPTYLIFLTDGLPTQGETETTRILANFAQAAPRSLRLFAFGVGYDVDTILLDTLAQEHHGTSSYVRPGEALDEIVSGFYSRVSTPVLTDLELDFGELSTSDLYPSPLPDLFLGSQIVAVGRYREGGSTTVTLSGVVNGEAKTFTFPEQVFARDSRGEAGSLAALPRLWATRKIGFLLNQVRLKGSDEETIDQIVRLSIRYGIVTPYTSYLVTEPMPLGREAQERIAAEELKAYQGAPQAAAGQDAVERAAAEGNLARAGSAAEAPEEAANRLRSVGSRAFVLQEGVWTDTGFDPQQMKPRRIAFLSEDYFALAESRPELRPVLALGKRVIFLVDGEAYEVAGEGEPGVTPEGATQVPTGTPEPAAQVFVPQAEDGPAKTGPLAPAACLGVLLPVGLMFLAMSLTRKKEIHD